MASQTIAGSSSGIIAALGILVGLFAGTMDLSAVDAVLAVVTAIVIVAVADAFASGFGVFLAHRTDPNISYGQAWKASLKMFASKFFIIVQFIIPFLIWPLFDATIVSIVYGLILLGFISSYLAKKQEKKKIYPTILFYLLASTIIMTITYFIGYLIAYIFALF